jgi:POT family proton-dependent oligopeptide transporter
MSTAPLTQTPAKSNQMPPSVPFIVGNEAAERFNYYGILAVLTLYITGQLGLSDADSTEIVHLFKFAAYFMPLLGAWIADRLWGRYNTILYLSLVYCVGNIVLAFTVGSRTGLYLGLLLIAVGTGGIKPCVSAFVGDQFGSGREHLLPKIYGMFYWSINFGSFFSFGFLPSVRDNFGYRWAFGIPGVAMLLATLIFWSGTRKYTIKPPTREPQKAGFFKVLSYALAHRGERRPGQGFWDVALAKFDAEQVAGARAVAGILMIFAPIPMFWALFDQTNSTWVIQGTKMVATTLFTFHLDPQSFVAPLLKGFFVELKGAGVTPGAFAFILDTERMQAMNPLYVMILIPIFTGWLYPWAEKLGVKPTALRRMGAGMLLAAGSFLVTAWIQARLDAGVPMSIAWQMVPYLLITSGEVMLSATGLEFAFSRAPASMKSTIMSFWLLTVAVGNFLVAAVTNLNDKVVQATGAMQFLFYAALTFLVAGIFIWCATRYRERPQQPSEATAAAAGDAER